MNTEHSFVLKKNAESFNRLSSRTESPEELIYSKQLQTKNYTLMKTLTSEHSKISPCHDSSKPIIILVHLAGFYWLSFKNRKYVLQRLVNTSEKFMYVPRGVAGNIATDPVVMDAIAHSKAI